MNKKKVTVKILSTAMAASLVLPSPIYAAGKISKDETVYVELDSQGKNIETRSSIWLHSDAPLKEIKDKSTLEDVVNVKGDEEATIKGNQLNWTTEEKNLYYQGDTEKDLPLNVNIQYFLDDKEVLPENILGESGQLKMKIKIENKDRHSIKLENGEERDLYTPYLVGTAVVLPSDTFDQVEVNAGKVVSDASKQIVGFVSLPGLQESLNLKEGFAELPDYLELTADVTDFESFPVAIMAKSELPEMDEFDFLDDFGELMDGMNQMDDVGRELTDGSKRLLDGQEELNNGITSFNQGVQKIEAGTNPLFRGSGDLKDGMNDAYSASQELKNGSDLLSDNAKKLSNAYIALADGTIKYSEQAQKFSKGIDQLGEEMEKLPAASQKLNQGMSQILENSQSIHEGQSVLTTGLKDSQKAITEIKGKKDQETEAIQSLKQSINQLEEWLDQLDDGNEKEQIKVVIQQQKESLEKMLGSSQQLAGALGEVEKGLETAASSSEKLSEGSKELNEGQEFIADGLGELEEKTEKIPEVRKEFKEASQSFHQAAAEIKEKSLEAKKASNQFANGGEKLANGSGQLSNGLAALNTASGQLNQGIAELSNGANELGSAGQNLKNGSDQLIDGTSELNEGLNEFYKEGIKKIQEEINSAGLDIEELSEVKDELVNLAKENDSFSGKTEEMDGELKFIMKTEQVKNDEEEKEGEKPEEEVNNQNNKGFLNWLKNFFKKSFNL